MSIPSSRFLDREHWARLAKTIERDKVWRLILENLSSGRWHNILDLTRKAKIIDKNIGMVRIGTIIHEIQEIMSGELLEKNPTTDTDEWRINPRYIEPVQGLLQQARTEP